MPDDHEHEYDDPGAEHPGHEDAPDQDIRSDDRLDEPASEFPDWTGDYDDPASFATHDESAEGFSEAAGFDGVAHEDYESTAEPSWWAVPLDSALEPEPAHFTDPFPDDGPIPSAADGLAWSDAESIGDSGLVSLGVLPVGPLELLLDQDQRDAPTAAEQAVMDWVATF